MICLHSLSAQVPDKPAGYLTDAVGIIPNAEAKLLTGRCTQLDKNHRAQVAIVVVETLQGESIDKVALDLFQKWGIGHKKTNDGLLLMLEVRGRQSRITVGRGLERIISDDAAASILRSMRSDLQAARYGQALILALDAIEKLLNNPRDR
jgi:uncharacterized protein